MTRHPEKRTTAVQWNEHWHGACNDFRHAGRPDITYPGLYTPLKTPSRNAVLLCRKKCRLNDAIVNKGRCQGESYKRCVRT